MQTSMLRPQLLRLQLNKAVWLYEFILKVYTH